VKIWEVEFATEDGSLGEKLVCANDYQEAVEIAGPGIIAESKLDKREKKTLHVQKVALYCETDYGA